VTLVEVDIDPLVGVAKLPEPDAVCSDAVVTPETSKLNPNSPLLFPLESVIVIVSAPLEPRVAS
jgi:hypothetical protein